MTGLVLVLAAAGVVISLITYVTTVLSGGTKARVAGTAGEHAATIADLGPVVQTFTTYTPWRFRFGVLMIAVGLACVAATQLAEVPGGVNLVAGFSLLFGIVTLLYVAFTPISRLDLHARGLALYRGREGGVAAYYPDVRDVGYSTVSFTTNGVAGRPIAKGLAVNFHQGGGLEVGNDFIGFSKIEEAIRLQARQCAATGDLGGQYLVIGTHLNHGTPEEVTVEARSPRHAKAEALDQHGVMAERCEKVVMRAPSPIDDLTHYSPEGDEA